MGLSIFGKLFGNYRKNDEQKSQFKSLIQRIRPKQHYAIPFYESFSTQVYVDSSDTSSSVNPKLPNSVQDDHVLRDLYSVELPSHQVTEDNSGRLEIESKSQVACDVIKSPSLGLLLSAKGAQCSYHSKKINHAAPGYDLHRTRGLAARGQGTRRNQGSESTKIAVMRAKLAHVSVRWARAQSESAWLRK